MPGNQISKISRLTWFFFLSNSRWCSVHAMCVRLHNVVETPLDLLTASLCTQLWINRFIGFQNVFIFRSLDSLAVQWKLWFEWNNVVLKSVCMRHYQSRYHLKQTMRVYSPYLHTRYGNMHPGNACVHHIHKHISTQAHTLTINCVH